MGERVLVMLKPWQGRRGQRSNEPRRSPFSQPDLCALQPLDLKWTGRRWRHLVDKIELGAWEGKVYLLE